MISSSMAQEALRSVNANASSTSTINTETVVAVLSGEPYVIDAPEGTKTAKKKKGDQGVAEAVQKRHDWRVMFQALEKFGEEKGHCNGE